MIEVNNEIYSEMKQMFFEKHQFDFETHTSSMEEDGTYGKTYAFADNSAWFEKMSPVTEIAKVNVHDVEVEVPVKLQRVEFWTTDISKTLCYYERW